MSEEPTIYAIWRMTDARRRQVAMAAVRLAIAVDKQSQGLHDDGYCGTIPCPECTEVRDALTAWRTVRG
jgi:hypothetical protein